MHAQSTLELARFIKQRNAGFNENEAIPQLLKLQLSTSNQKAKQENTTDDSGRQLFAVIGMAYNYWGNYII